MVYGRLQQDREEKRKLIRNFFGDDLERMEFNVPIEFSEISLIGIVDAILHFKNGEITPLEMKYTDYMDLNIQKKKQIYAYSVLIEHLYKNDVKYGYILFIKQRKIKKLPVTEEDKIFIKRDIEKLMRLLEMEKVPPYTHASRCRYCEVKKFCGRPGI